MTLVGMLALNGANAASFMNDDKAKSGVASGIAQFLGVTADMVSVTFSASRRLSERELAGSTLQVTYAVGVLSGNAPGLTAKLTQASQTDFTTSINTAVAASGSQAGQVTVTSFMPPATSTSLPASTTQSPAAVTTSSSGTLQGQMGMTTTKPANSTLRTSTSYSTGSTITFLSAWFLGSFSIPLF